LGRGGFWGVSFVVVVWVVCFSSHALHGFCWLGLGVDVNVCIECLVLSTGSTGKDVW